MNLNSASLAESEWTGAVRRAALLLMIATGLAVASTVVDRSTRLDVFSDGGRIHLEVAGTTLSVSRTVHSLTAVEIRAKDSIHPPGGRSIRLSTGESTLFDERLPRRFRFPKPGLTPVGDWEIDEKAAHGSVWRREVRVTGPFSLEASFRGRFLHDLTVVLHGEPTTSIAVRRGLINDDCFIRDEAGADIAYTSIDPSPLADAGAVAATMARAAAVACGLMACFTLLRARSRPHPLPAASPRWRSAPLVLALAAAAVAISLWVAGGILEGLPHTPDSLVYLLQAEWLTGGSLWGSVTPLQKYLSVPFTYGEGGRWLAHYPAGWPVLLAFGLALGKPWIVAPLLGGAYVALLYVAGREIQGPELGLTASTLAVISPLARMIFGSMLSHAAAATLVLAALVATLLACRKSSWAFSAAAGAAVGLAFGIRPLTAVAVSIPLGALLACTTHSGRLDGRVRLRGYSFAGGAILAALPSLAANTAITGSPWSFPYSLVEGSMYGTANLPFGLRNLDVLLASGGTHVTGWGWDLVHGPWIIALSFAFACMPLLAGSRRCTDWALAAMVLCVLTAHLGTRGHGLHGFGPRYHFEVLAPFLLLTARGFFTLAGSTPRGDRQERKLPVAAAFALFLALCLPAAAILPERLGLYRGYNGVDGGLLEQLAALPSEPAVVLLPPGEWQGWAAAWPSIDWEPDAILLVLQADQNDPLIIELAQSRTVYHWRNPRLVPARAKLTPKDPP